MSSVFLHRMVTLSEATLVAMDPSAQADTATSPLGTWGTTPLRTNATPPPVHQPWQRWLQEMQRRYPDARVIRAPQESRHGISSDGSTTTTTATPVLLMASGPFRDDSLSAYYDDITRFGASLLDKDREAKLARRIQTGDESAHTQLVQANLKLVLSIVKKYRSIPTGMTRSDLIQEGNLGLIRAASKFDPSQGFRFSTYAPWWIRQFIECAIRGNEHVTHVPYNALEAWSRIVRTRTLLAANLHRNPTVEEISAHSEISVDVIMNFEIRMQGALSLDTPLPGSEGDFTLRSSLVDTESGSPGENWDNTELREQIELILATLDPRQAQIIRLHYGLRGHEQHTLREVAKMMGVSHETVRKDLLSALAKLRLRGEETLQPFMSSSS